MSNTYSVTVRERKTSKGRTVGYEGIVSIPGVRPTKLTRRDGKTIFQTPSALSSSVRSLSSRTSLDFDLITSKTKSRAAKKKSKK